MTKVTDLIERLKDDSSDFVYHERHEAAAELLRLSSEVQRLDNSGIHTCWDECPRLPCVQRREIDRLSSECEALREALAEEREENLWNAYNSGHVKDGRWTHMFMSDGEWLARMCGFDPKEADYDDATIRAAIPVAARTTLQETNGGGDVG